MGANMKLAEVMSTTTKTMKNMNSLLKPEQISADMQNFSKTAMKMDMTDEMSKYCVINIYFSNLFLNIPPEEIYLA